MEPLTPAAAGSVAERFRAVVRAVPERLAVRGRDVAWSYSELDAAARRIARLLRDREADPGRPVLLFLETDAPLIAAMLGTLQAGLFYAPVDPAFAPRHAASLAALADPALIVTRRGLRAAAGALREGAEILEVDGPPVSGPAADDLPAVPPEAPAYVLFTSGSTGESKGVLQAHRNLLSNAGKLTAGLGLTADDRISLLTSASYGASVSDVYGALLNGAAVLPFDPRGASPAAWRGWAAAVGLTVWHSVPGLFRAFARAVDDPAELPGLRAFKIGGEPVFAADLDLFRRRFREGAAFHVGLGMTEMNVICQWHADHGTACPTPVTPVGRPAPGLTALLLGPGGEPLKEGEGEEGELAVAAATLPVYWRRPGLTARAFRPLPGSPEERLFLTGDLARRLPGGDLLLLGRRDRQLKVRGLRVDAAAVEAALRDQPDVREAVVDARPSGRGERVLMAWVVPEGEARPDLRARLGAVLPPEAVPAHLVPLAELPTLGPGKVDRGRLPDPPAGRRELETPFVPPEPGEEAAVAGAFAALFGIAEVGALDDFFALGGTSLLTLDALLALERELRQPVDPALFLADPTPRGIARRLSEERGPLAALAEGVGTPVFFIPGHGAGEGPDLLQLARIARRARLAGPSLALRLPPAGVETAAELVAVWLAAVLARQPEGPWRLVAACGGGPLGATLARRLSARGEARLALHDAIFPTPVRRLRQRLRRWREPWGDDLLARFVHHLRALRARGLGAALRYAAGRSRSLAHGIQRSTEPAVRRMVDRQDLYLRLALTAPPEPWNGEALLILTPARRAKELVPLWRTVLPRLCVCETGDDAEGDSAAALRGLFGGAP